MGLGLSGDTLAKPTTALVVCRAWLPWQQQRQRGKLGDLRTEERVGFYQCLNGRGESWISIQMGQDYGLSTKMEGKTWKARTRNGGGGISAELASWRSLGSRFK